jgi:hypothetical protein
MTAANCSAEKRARPNFTPHEMTHVIDGNRHEISGSESWQRPGKLNDSF